MRVRSDKGIAIVPVMINRSMGASDARL
jgi:hypothetical protein